MIRFTLFGIPVEIQPWFWVTGALLGGGMRADTQAKLLGVALFMVVSAISILVHEFGHALTGRRLAGGRTSVVLWGMGGLAYHEGARFTRSSRFWTVAAGPGAGFVLAALTVAGLCVAFGAKDGLKLGEMLAFGFRREDVMMLSPDAAGFLVLTPRLLIVQYLILINFWWSLVNLLPVLPLDGGQITDLFVKPQKRVYEIGMITAAAMAVFGLVFMGSPYIALMFGFFCWQNYQSRSSSGWR